jgi:type VI secretion system secreted protein Hcp
MAERWFLKLDGIDGESTDAAHKGELDVLSWSWGVTQSGSPGGGGGGGAGKATFADFQFTSGISKASPALFLAAATGSHIASAVLTGIRTAAKGKGLEFLTYTLTDVMVTSVQHGDSVGTVPTEQFALSYSKFQVSYSPTNAKGKLDPPVQAGFDLKTNKKI